MSITAILAKPALIQAIKSVGGPIIRALLKKGKVGDVLEGVIDVATQQNGGPVTEDALQDMAQSDPETFSNVVQSAEETHQARWATLLAESQSSSFFIAGARPAAIWAAIGLLLFAGVMTPVITWICAMAGIAPPPGVEPIIWETIAWLLPLLYAARGVEGVFGSKRSRL